MNVKEVRELAPLADVYEIRPDAKYLFVFGGDTYFSAEVAGEMQAALEKRGISNVLLMAGDGVRVFDLSSDMPRNDVE